MFLDKIKYLFLILIVIGLFLPFIASAGWLDGPIVPCGIKSDPDREAPCTLCHIFEMGKNIIQFIWELVITIAPVFILIGGVMILTAGAKPDQATLGKKVITNAIIGVVIALLAWTILSMVFNALVTDDKSKFPWPWNEVHCKGGEVSEGEEPSPVEEGEYCVCEVPVYDLNPNEYPSQASIIGTNIKATKLTDKDACKQGCVSGNANTYCPFTLTISKAKFYCADKSSLESKRTCGVKLTTQETSIDCQISSECFATSLDCATTVTPQHQNFNREYTKRCFINGEPLCNYALHKGDEGYCSNKYPSPCTSPDRKYALYRWKSEISEFEKNAYDCSRNAYGNTEIVCRLDCQYDKVCARADRCSQLSSVGSCFGNYTCQKGVIDQQGFASDELKKLLACMANKSYLPAEAREISSIMDNSGGRCLQNWNNQCSSRQDSCKGTCCGHSRDSLHYGGDFDKRDRSACRINSWAVDFAREEYFDQIKKAAKECGDEIPILKEFGKGGKGIDVEKEPESNPNHVHVELDGIARYYYKCM